MFKLSSSILIFAICAAMPAAAETYVPESPRKTKAVYDAADNTVTVSAQAPKYTEFDWETYVQEELPYISYVLIERHITGTPWYDADYEIGRVQSVEPGKEFTFIDTEVEADRKYEYKLTCYVDTERGTSAYANVYTGITPGQVTAFTASTVDHLTHTVDFSITAPLLSDHGVQLTAPMAIEIQEYRDWSWEQLHSIPDVEPGATATWHQEGLENGAYHYRAVAKLGQAGTGEGLEADVYVGLDAPGVPRNLKCDVEGESVSITWELPERGHRGGSYDPESTTYTITRKFNDGTTTEAARGVSGTGYTDTPGFDEEAAVSYAIEAVNSAGASMSTDWHNPVNVGAPAKLPFKESFVSGMLDHKGWTLESSQDDPDYTYEAWTFVSEGAMFYLPTDEYLEIAPQDNDEGLASVKFYGYSADGQTESFISPRLDTENAAEAELTFHYYDVCSDASMNQIHASVSLDGGEWEELFVSEQKAETEPHWQKISLPVQLEGKCSAIKVKIDAVRHDGPITNVYIDNISVTSKPMSSINSVECDPDANTTAEYYNLQGIRVAEPTLPGAYIVRRGSVTTKTIIR